MKKTDEEKEYFRKQTAALNRTKCCVMVIKKGEPKECGKRATKTAWDRQKNWLYRVCEKHEETVAARDKPDHIAHCPGCGCVFGVGG